ncbi:MAG: DUF2115 domain-containing protein [Methanomicrobiaceae archaeon]|nr:DUF2115 domain-containing protein [Methanomicrobiaceae archaeon]
MAAGQRAGPSCGDRPHASGAGEVRALFVDTFGEEGHDGGAPEHDARDTGSIARACARMARARTKRDLAELLAAEVKRYTLSNLEEMNARIEHTMRDLPEGYRERLRPFVREQIFGTHHRLLVLACNGATAGLHAAPDPAAVAYFAMVEEACRAKAREKDPGYLYLKYLLAAFAMFVVEEPAHPVGTPFPGGQIVDVWDGTYLCPVREMADDVPYSLCPFCPAKQSTEPTFPWMRGQRRERERQACLANYWTNYKG